MLKVKRSGTNNLEIWFWSIDFKIILTVLTLLGISILLDLSASPYVAIRLHAYPLYFFYRHITYVALSIITLITISFCNVKQVKTLSLIIFSVGLLGIIATLLLNIEVKGARRWVHILGFSLQPSEFIKISFPVILAMALEYFGQRFEKVSAYLVMIIIYICVISLIIMQPDLGMTILITVIFATILFVTEVNFFWILLLACLGVIALIAAYFVFSHVEYRINSFFNPEKSYQIMKALEAIQEGGLFGTGEGLGVVKEFLPDAHTDFIFAVAVEEYGLIFAAILIAIYIYLFYRCFKRLQVEYNSFNYVSGTGFLSILIMQTFIHISTNINLIPAKGVTLPFISYGGTSLLANAILVGFFLVLTKKKLN